MPFRNTKGIVTESGDPIFEADVIMTAATLGFAAAYIAETGNPIRFDMDPLDVQKDEKSFTVFTDAIGRMNEAIHSYLVKMGIASSEVQASLSPQYGKGAVIMGIYKLAGQTAPESVTAPVLSKAGQSLYDRIKNMEVPQYTGRGAYTGFVDNNNTEGDTNPVGPRSTARFPAPVPGRHAPDPHPRWLPPIDCVPPAQVWNIRERPDGTYVPWGMIGGDFAGSPPDPTQPNAIHATNLADQMTNNMALFGMVFNGDINSADIAAYTHGMVQAIYKAYSLGPSCTPYEIAVGDVTKKMASCIPCTLFMYSLGYPPTAIHLGRGESWAPLYEPYNPNGVEEENESGVIRDLNNAWYANCLKWINIGLEILDDSHIMADHKPSQESVKQYLNIHAANAFNGERINFDVPDYTVAGVLILDALTIHRPELDRIKSTLTMR